jgi:Fe-S-cluster-containing dehydrogenase component
MGLDRRGFLKSLAVVGSACCGARAGTGANATPEAGGKSRAVLMDIPNCIGCRKCEFACQQAASFDVPPIESFDDKSVFATHRRPSPGSNTTVNAFFNPKTPEKPTYVKANCLHCVAPACASACLVGALRKTPDGPVVYDPWKCMGCRYCMVACPFGIPTYDYHNALTPQVRKCNFCADRIAKEGGVPECVKICPNEALTFGYRDELLALAHERIAKLPERYVNHVYGEAEAGGTSWLYLSSVPFDQIGFLKAGLTSPSDVTEVIQHGVFKHWLPPLALYGLLAIMTRQFKREKDAT